MLRDYIKHLREEKKLTQEELAARIGLSKQIISYWETGRRNPTSSQRLKLVNFFHINEADLFVQFTTLKSEHILKVFDILRNLSKEHIADWFIFGEFLVKKDEKIKNPS